MQLLSFGPDVLFRCALGTKFLDRQVAVRVLSSAAAGGDSADGIIIR
ncbi:MAG TPA: hypothetical protein VGR35_15150 [Tepidisphaeraceae bacterium]|nr:hypothetical protein [Tepidisphaeraceae bacterium]